MFAHYISSEISLCCTLFTFVTLICYSLMFVLNMFIQIDIISCRIFHIVIIISMIWIINFTSSICFISSWFVISLSVIILFYTIDCLSVSCMSVCLSLCQTVCLSACLFSGLMVQGISGNQYNTDWAITIL